MHIKRKQNYSTDSQDFTSVLNYIEINKFKASSYRQSSQEANMRNTVHQKYKNKDLVILENDDESDVEQNKDFPGNKLVPTNRSVSLTKRNEENSPVTNTVSLAILKPIGVGNNVEQKEQKMLSVGTDVNS